MWVGGGIFDDLILTPVTLNLKLVQSCKCNMQKTWVSEILYSRSCARKRGDLAPETPEWTPNKTLWVGLIFSGLYFTGELRSKYNRIRQHKITKEYAVAFRPVFDVQNISCWNLLSCVCHCKHKARTSCTITMTVFNADYSWSKHRLWSLSLSRTIGHYLIPRNPILETRVAVT